MAVGGSELAQGSPCTFGLSVKGQKVLDPNALSVSDASVLWCLTRSGAAGSLQPPGGQGRTGEVLHRQGSTAGSELQRRGQRRGGQLAGSHDPALQQWSLSCRWILSPWQCQR